MKKPIAHVTDHAIVRYLERVEGMDIERLRREIGHRVDRGVEKGASAVTIDGWRYALSPNGTVVTVAEACRPELRPGPVMRPRRERPE